MLKDILKKTLSISLCFFLLNLIVYGNANTTSLKKGDQICMSKNNIGSLFASVFGWELAEETIPENSDTSSKNRSQLSEEEVHSLFIHSLDICFKTPFADTKAWQQHKNSHLSTHIIEITPPPPKA